MMGRWGWLWGAGLMVGLGLPGVAALAEPGAVGLEPVRVAQGGEAAETERLARSGTLR